jgi:hypothetical protein
MNSRRGKHMVLPARCDRLLGGGFCQSKGGMASGNGRHHSEDPLLAKVQKGWSDITRSFA